MRVIIEKAPGHCGEAIAEMIAKPCRSLGFDVVIVTPTKPKRERDAALGIADAA